MRASFRAGRHETLRRLLAEKTSTLIQAYPVDLASPQTMTQSMVKCSVVIRYTLKARCTYNNGFGVCQASFIIQQRVVHLVVSKNFESYQHRKRESCMVISMVR